MKSVFTGLLVRPTTGLRDKTEYRFVGQGVRLGVRGELVTRGGSERILSTVTAELSEIAPLDVVAKRVSEAGLLTVSSRELRLRSEDAPPQRIHVLVAEAPGGYAGVLTFSAEEVAAAELAAGVIPYVQQHLSLLRPRGTRPPGGYRWCAACALFFPLPAWMQGPPFYRFALGQSEIVVYSRPCPQLPTPRSATWTTSISGQRFSVSGIGDVPEGSRSTWEEVLRGAEVIR